MEKKLKNCYKQLDLSYGATIEEVETREKAMCKILLSQANDDAKCKKQIANIKAFSSYIVENIKKNGIPTEEYHRFESSKESIVSLVIILFFVALICYFSFTML